MKYIPNHPNEPIRIPQSAQVMLGFAQANGRKSLLSDDAMITKRSNHIPTLMKMEMTKSAVRLLRIFLNQSSWDTKALLMIIDQPAHHIEPNGRRKNVVC